MAWGFQVKLEERQNGTAVAVWRDVHPTGGAPYRYEEKTEAERMARMCYGTDQELVRVVEVP